MKHRCERVACRPAEEKDTQENMGLWEKLSREEAIWIKSLLKMEFIRREKDLSLSPIATRLLNHLPDFESAVRAVRRFKLVKIRI